MASSSSTSENCYDADHTVLEPILRKLSDLQKQLSEMECSHVGDRKQGRGNHFELLPADLIYIQSAPEKLDSFKSHVKDRLSELEKCVNDIFESVPRQRLPESVRIFSEQVKPKIHSLAISIANLKARVLQVSRVTSTAVGTDKKEKTDDTVHPHNQLFEQNLGDGYSSMFIDLVKDLDKRARNLLLYFAAFPPGTIINKRVLKNWWIAEVLSQLPADEAEKKADRVLEELVLRCLIVAVRKQRRLDGFKTPHPWVHFALVSFAKKEGFFAFDDKGNATLEPNTSKGCLIKVKNVSSVDVLNRSGVDASLEKLQTLFNISEQYPHFKDEVFSKLKNVNVLSVGKWQSRQHACHIEVESTEFLKAQKSLKDLKFFSLRGVSRVSELPDALCKLSSLRILDLNACYNLEELPEGIGSLKSLIYLDISECYLLEKMPKGLASLTELRVLKGFLIIDAMEGSSSCNFKDLSGLKKLIKLGISANKREFPTDDDLDTFKMFPLLEKLTISWGGKSLLKMLEGQTVNAERMSDPESEVQPQKANGSLKPKLELQPGEAAPCTVDDRTAELRKISDDSNPLDIADNQAGTDSAAESKLRGPGDQDDAGSVAEKVTEPTLVEGTGNTGEIIEKTEPAIEEISTSAVNGGKALERKDTAVKSESDIKGVNTGGETRRDQQLQPRKNPIRTSSFLRPMKRRSNAEPKPKEIFPSLEKLNLQCYPKEEAPDWLKPQNMKKLKKLYFVGGKLHTLNRVQGNRAWTVETLRLKYLKGLKTSCEELLALFPKLIYLEKVQDEMGGLLTFRRNWKGEWVQKKKYRS